LRLFENSLIHVLLLSVKIVLFSVLNINLLTNGDAETGLCETGENVTHPTGWHYNGSITQVSYNASYYGSLSYTDPGPK
jgi:hypothetical protein